MKCSNCGAELSDDSKFCSYCGQKIDAVSPPVMEETENPTDFHIDEPEEISNHDAPKSFTDKLKDKGIEIWNALSLYGKVATVSIAIFVLLGLVALLADKTIAVVISIIQIAMVVVSVLMHKGVIKLEQDKLWLKWLVLAVAVLFTALNIMSYSWGSKTTTTGQNPSSSNQNTGETAEQIDWKNITLSKVLPEPQSNMMELLYNGDDWLNVTVCHISENDFLEYVRWCKDDYGFTVDSDSFDDYFYAYNKDGYCVTLFYTKTSKKLSIDLSAPIGDGAIDPDDNTTDADDNNQETIDYTLDYADAASFEKALNDGKKVNGKIVQFEVIEYKPDSILGVNCWAGEHLNFISEDKLDVESGNIIVGKITKEPSKTLTGSWKIYYDVLSITKGESVTQTQKNGFDSSTNEIYTLASYTVEIPKYWKSESKIDSGFQRYAETNGKVAMLQVSAQVETDDSYPVTFDGLMDDNDNMIAVIESTAFEKVTDYEVVDTGIVKGILYKGTIIDKDSGLTGYAEWFEFASEEDRTWCTLIFCQTDNTEYSYTDDFMKVIKSIKPLEGSSGEYSVAIHIDFVENWFFSTYDVTLSVNGTQKGTMDHGVDDDFELQLDPGTYTIKFAKKDDSSVKGEVELVVDCDIDASYKITCYSDKVSVTTIFIDRLVDLADNEIKMDVDASDYKYKDYKEVESELSSLGFTNIQYKILYDIVWGWTDEGEVKSVSIDGNEDFARGDIFKKDAPIIITYHMKEEDDPNKQTEASETTSTPSTSDSSTSEKKYDLDKNLYVVQCTQDSDKTTMYRITFAECDANGNYTTFYTFDSIINPRTMGDEFNAIGPLPSWFYIGALVHVQANLSGGVIKTSGCTVTQATKSTTDTTIAMPTMEGSSLDSVATVAKNYGLSAQYSDEDWGNGSKMRSMSNSKFAIKIVYSSDTKEILMVSVVSYVANTTTQEQKDFIKAIASVACPSSDSSNVSQWVNSNVGTANSAEINGRTYELLMGSSNNLCYSAGVSEWEAWDLEVN